MTDFKDLTRRRECNPEHILNRRGKQRNKPLRLYNIKATTALRALGNECLGVKTSQYTPIIGRLLC